MSAGVRPWFHRKRICQLTLFHLNFFETNPSVSSKEVRGVTFYSSVAVDVLFSPQGWCVWDLPVGGAPPQMRQRCSWNRTPLSSQATLGPHLLRTGTLVLSEPHMTPWSCITNADRNTQLTIGADHPVSCWDRTEQDLRRSQQASSMLQLSSKNWLITATEAQANVTKLMFIFFWFIIWKGWMGIHI